MIFANNSFFFPPALTELKQATRTNNPLVVSAWSQFSPSAVSISIERTIASLPTLVMVLSFQQAHCFAKNVCACHPGSQQIVQLVNNVRSPRRQEGPGEACKIFREIKWLPEIQPCGRHMRAARETSWHDHKQPLCSVSLVFELGRGLMLKVGMSAS